MDSILTVTTDGGSPDRWRCTDRSFAAFRKAEALGNLGKAMALWRVLIPSGGKKAPRSAIPFADNAPNTGNADEQVALRFQDFNTPPSASLFKPTLTDTCEADVSAPSPYDFLWSAPGRSPVRLEDITSAILRKALTWDLLVCRELAYPFYHRIEQQIDDVVHRYMRLLLPVADGHGRVCRIYAFCRPLAPRGAQEQQQAFNLI